MKMIKGITRYLLLLTVFAIVVNLVGCTSKNNDKELFKLVSRDTVVNELDKSSEPYYLLVCDKIDSQCSALIEDLRSIEEMITHDVYLLDIQPYIQNISKQDMSEEERTNYINEYNRVLYDVGATKIPSITLRKSGEIIAEKKGYFSEEYYQQLAEGKDVQAYLDKYHSELKDWFKGYK